MAGKASVARMSVATCGYRQPAYRGVYHRARFRATRWLMRATGYVASTKKCGVLKQGFNSEGAVVSYLENKGDDHETYDSGTGLGIRALNYVRTCARKSKSSQVRRQDPPRCGWHE
jgi:hypothetical protein